MNLPIFKFGPGLITDASVAPTQSIFLYYSNIFRIEPPTGDLLRIMLMRANTANDRESVFWLNILDISAKP